MRSGFRKICLFLLILLVLLFASFFALRSKYRLTIRDLAETSVKNATSDLANDAIAQQIENGNIQYDRIVYFEKDLNGRITALKTNIGEVNHLKTDILNIINGKILALDAADIGIPIGSLFLPEFFSGKGPTIPVRILAIRNSEASFTSNFCQAGINQTLHQLIMEVDVDAAVLVLGETSTFSVSSQVVVAETVIVGEVPDTFIQAGDAVTEKLFS